MRLNLEQGIYLVKLARNTIEEYLQTGKVAYGVEVKEAFPELKEPRGVFCTLNTFPEKQLRGCIGLPYPEKPLLEAVREAAISSTRDPRFPPLAKEELNKVTVELSILTQPELIRVSSPEEYLEKIEPGKDGLILRYKEPRSGAISQGLFLPQVWEELPQKEEFLSNLCYKAGIWNPKAWKHPNAELLRFRVQVFEEETPRGEIIEKLL